MDIFAYTFNAKEYSPSNEGYIDALKAVDPNFCVGTKVADINHAAKYVYQCEYPHRHHVSFDLPAIIPLLPNMLHENYDKTKPIRLAFDIEREYNPELVRLAVNKYKAEGKPPARLSDILAEHFGGLVGYFTAEIGEVLAERFLGKFAVALDGSKKKKIKPEDLQPTVLDSCRLVNDNYLMAVSQNSIGLPPKFSYHIIYTNVWMFDSYESKMVCDAVYSKINAVAPKFASMIDRAIYSHVNFRAYGCCKKGEPERILKQIDEFEVQIRDEFNLQRGHNPTHVMPYKKRKEQQQDQVRQQHNGEFAELIELNHEILRGFTLENQCNRYIRLRGADGAICPICARHHRSGAQNYIRRTKFGYELGCGHPDGKGKQPVALRHTIDIANYQQQHAAILRGINIYTAKDTDNTIRINKKYIEDDLAVEYARGANMLFVSSPMGTGKTYALKKLLDVTGSQSICMLSFRKAFTAEKAKDLGLVSYLDINGKLSKANANKHIIQVEALGRLEPDFLPNVLIIDEMESILEQINKTNGNMYAAAIQKLNDIIAKARAIIIMDANLTCAAIKYFTRVRQDLTYRIIVNEYRHTGITAKVYAHTSQVTDAFIRHIESGAAAVMCSDSKAILDDARDRLICKGVPPDQIFVASSETAEERKRLVDEQGNITVVVSNYRAFLYNTTILAGVSIEDPTKTQLFAVFISNFITPSAACQLIGRVRQVETLHIAATNIDIVPRKKSTHIGILMRTECDNLFANAKEASAHIPRLLRLFASNLAAREFGQATLLQCIVVLLSRHGYNIDFAFTGRHRPLIGALVKAKDAEIERIIATPNTEYAKAKFDKIRYLAHVPEGLHKYLTKAEIKTALRPEMALMLDNLLYIEQETFRGSQLGVMCISGKYDAVAGLGDDTNDIDTLLAAGTGTSSAAYLTGLAIALLRSLDCDLSGNIPRCGDIPRGTWQAKVEKFAQDNAILCKDNAARIKKVNGILNAAFGIKFKGSKLRERTEAGRLPFSYTLEVNKDIELVGSRWQLKCIRRAEIEAQKKEAEEILAGN